MGKNFRCKPDYGLIKQWDKVALPLAPPFVSKFAGSGKQLWYVAARHEGRVKSATLKTVKHAFDGLKPEAVIIEGVANTGVVSPGWYVDYCKDQAKSDYADSGEAAYATVLAAE